MRSLLQSINPLKGGRVLWTGVLLSLTVGSLLYFVTAKTIESDLQKRFAGITSGGQYTISARIKSYTDLLRGAASLFQADRNVSREQFHRYVAGLDIQRNFPGIEVINYARLVTEQERPAFEQTMREELAKQGIDTRAFAIKPPGRRTEYTILSYIEPSKGWQDRYGLDLGAPAYARAPLAHARDTGELTASGVKIAVLSGPNRFGMAIRLPIYRNDMHVGTVEERRAAYLGTIGMGFGVNKLIQGVLDEIPLKGVHLRVFDVNQAPAVPRDTAKFQVLFDSTKTDVKLAAMDVDDIVRASFPITFHQREWQADFSIPKTALYSGLDVYFPWLAMLAGGLSTGLLYALFQTLSSSRRRAIAMAEEMTKEVRASQADLQASHHTLRRLAAHADQIKEGERKRIAREIHDELGQNLLALRIDAEMLTERTRATHSRLHTRANATLSQIDATIKSVRQIINDLRPNVLDLGLNAAVDWLVTDFARRTGIECDLLENEAELRIDDHCATAFFRILQESLTNISRHAHATKVQIELHLLANTLTMTVSDNGIGLPRRGRHKLGSFGLVGIEERVNILNGTFSINSVAGVGTTVVVAVPVGRMAGLFEMLVAENSRHEEATLAV